MAVEAPQVDRADEGPRRLARDDLREDQPLELAQSLDAEVRRRSHGPPVNVRRRTPAARSRRASSWSDPRPWAEYGNVPQ